MSPAIASVAQTPALEIEGVSKSFPGVRALTQVDLSLLAGSVTALIGENGAGKSTLVKILTGIYQPDGGVLRVDGKLMRLADAADAMHHGISAIHQETVLFDELSVAENIFLGHAPRRRFGIVDWSAMVDGARRLLNSIGVSIDPRAILKDLSIAERHLVAIARALSVDARIVIMDEPTAALSQKEVADLFVIVRRLRDQGRAILFISHKFEEIYEIADRFVVFRDGRAVGHGFLSETSHENLVRLMVGRSVDQVFPKIPVSVGEIVMRVRGLCHPTEFHDISFDLRRGEILGFYGLVGAGRSEVCQALFGKTRRSAGSVELDGRTVAVDSPAEAVAAGIAYVPEERGRHGAVLALPIFENISMAVLGRTTRAGFLREPVEFDLARHYAERLDLRAASLSVPVGTLSGGNQQKVVLGKWLATKPRVIILDEPTKGIDIGSKSAVHHFMGQLAAAGLSVIMVSSELPEILGMSDRVLVMREGRLIGIWNRGDVDAETLVRAATGNS